MIKNKALPKNKNDLQKELNNEILEAIIKKKFEDEKKKANEKKKRRKKRITIFKKEYKDEDFKINFD